MHPATLAARIWFLSSLVLDSFILVFFLLFNPREWFIFLPGFLVIFAASVPVLIILAILLPIIRKLTDSYNNKIYLTILVCGICACIYGFIGLLINYTR